MSNFLANLLGVGDVRVEDLERRIIDLQVRYDNLSESYSNAVQGRGNAEHRMKEMVRHRTDLNSVSLKAAIEIEDCFAGVIVGRSRRLARVQIIIRDVLEKQAAGEVAYRTREPQTPVEDDPPS